MEDQTQVSQEGFPTLEATQAPAGDAQLTLFNLQEVAVRQVDSIKQLKDKIKEAHGMYNDSLNHNSSFIKRSDSLKEIQKEIQGLKRELNKTPEAAHLLQKIKDLRYELKEKTQAISDYAQQVASLSGNNQFEKDGVRYQIVTVATLVKVQQ